MKCKSCGAEAPAEAVFCPACGERLEAAASAPAPPASSGSSEAVDAPEGRADARTAVERIRAASGDPAADLDDEKTMWRGGYCAKAMIGAWLLAGAAALLLAVGFFYFLAFRTALLATAACVVLLAAALGLTLAYRKLSVWYELTTQRFIHKSGILRRVTNRIEVIDIDDITFTQGLLQRIFGVGSIQIVSSDRTDPDLRLRGIGEVRRVAELIDDVRRAERRRRGLHIESI